MTALAHLAAVEGEYERARALWEQNLAEARELDRGESIALAPRGLADVARRRAAPVAHSLYAQSLEVALELEDPRQAIFCLEEAAATWATEGEEVRAARLFGAADALRDRFGVAVRPDELADGDPWVADTRAALDRERFAVAWAEGHALSREQVVAEALGEARRQ